MHHYPIYLEDKYHICLSIKYGQIWQMSHLSHVYSTFISNQIQFLAQWYIYAGISSLSLLKNTLETLSKRFETLWKPFWNALKPIRTWKIFIYYGLSQQDVSTVSTKLVYSYLLSAAHVTPHCVAKFFPQFGPLYWFCTWRQLFFFDLDRQVIDLAWKVAHAVLYTASRLVSFSVPLVCFCGPVNETLVYLFFDCPLAQSTLSWLQSLIFRWSCLAPSLECRHVLFGFNSHDLRTVPRVFCYSLNVVKYCL